MDGSDSTTMAPTRLPVTALRVWSGNPRKSIDPTALAELTASVRSLKGVKTPLLVRALGEPEGEVTHEVLAGQRRLLAARAADVADVPVSVEDLDDASALELALSENGSRRDAPPLEDAEAVERLITEHGRSVERAARVLGRSVRWVERRRSLLRLVPDARAWMRSGELPTGHAEALAALDPASQEEVLKRFRLGGEAGGWRDPGSARAWARELSYALRALAHAPWELADKSLPGGACAGCPRRSDTQQDLFGGAVESAHCLDAACWNGKVAAHWVSAQKLAKRRKLAVIDAPCVSSWNKQTPYSHEFATLDGLPADVEVPVVAMGRDEHGAVYDLVRRADLAAAMQARAKASAPTGGLAYDPDGEEEEDAQEVARRTAREQAHAAQRAKERARAARLWALAQRPELAAKLARSGLIWALSEYDCDDVLRAAGIENEARFLSRDEAATVVGAHVTHELAPVLLLAALGSMRLLDEELSDELIADERELVALLDAPEAPAEPSPTPSADTPGPGPAQPPPLPPVRVWIAADAWDELGSVAREEMEEPIGGCPVAWDGREGWVTALVDHAPLVCLRGMASEWEFTLHEGPEQPPTPVREEPVTTELRLSRSEWQKHRSELQDSSTGALHKQWMPDGSDRVAHVERSNPVVARIVEVARAKGLGLRVNGEPLAAPETAPAKATKKAKKGGGA